MSAQDDVTAHNPGFPPVARVPSAGAIGVRPLCPLIDTIGLTMSTIENWSLWYRGDRLTWLTWYWVHGRRRCFRANRHFLSVHEPKLKSRGDAKISSEATHSSKSRNFCERSPDL